MRASRGAWGCAILSLIGIGLAGYLYFLHLGLLRGELLGGPVCGSGAFNCHAVTAGSWGAFLGIPLSLWGILAYLAVFALSLLALQSQEWSSAAVTLIFLLAALSVAIDLVLFSVMVFVIRFYCLYCLLTYAVNLGLLLIAARSLGRPVSQAIRQAGAALGMLLPSPQRPAAGLFWGVMIVGVAGAAGVHAATTFVSRGSLASMRGQLREFVAKQPRVAVDVAGDPRLGSPDASVQMVEFSDFFCPACQRASKLNTILVASHRRQVAFVFKHYPLDTTCNDKIQRLVHPGACRIAAASECAHLQGKFWPLHDLIFEQGPRYNPGNLDGDAARIGLDVARFQACLESGEGLDAVKRDIAEGGKLGVTSTPTYVFNGVVVPGGINPTLFDDFLDALQGR